MIIGIGNDIVEIKRFMTLKEHFKDKFYTEREIEEAKGRASFFAENFSVKEAVSKSFGTGFRGFSGKDIEVLRDELGKPYVNLYGGAKKISESLGINEIFVSISDTDNLVMTMAVAESRNGGVENGSINRKSK